MTTSHCRQLIMAHCRQPTTDNHQSSNWTRLGEDDRQMRGESKSTEPSEQVRLSGSPELANGPEMGSLVNAINGEAKS
ncbi:hypothetical protein Nepgr_023371 [Nepenthes gracilis]|uniref:Uncharacterized protein n=1 Tax=Nepenthes gracilis TaxID=150966 RepID=A0AAD3T2X8_NEPGR|nr:hypothetical protein Nepgr_023371 [Nepenthes gracilis]